MGTEAESVRSAMPMDLEKGVCYLVKEKKPELSYRLINNGFLQTLMFVEHVNEFVMQRRAIILLPVSPDTLEEKELALLERNLKVLESPALPTDLEAREVSRLLDSY